MKRMDSIPALESCPRPQVLVLDPESAPESARPIPHARVRAPESASPRILEFSSLPVVETSSPRRPRDRDASESATPPSSRPRVLESSRATCEKGGPHNRIVVLAHRRAVPCRAVGTRVTSDVWLALCSFIRSSRTRRSTTTTSAVAKDCPAVCPGKTSCEELM